MKMRVLYFVGWWCSVFVASIATAQITTETAAADKEVVHQRLLECITDLRLASAGTPTKEFARFEQPLLDYQNPLFKAQGSGLVVFWHDEQVPIAIASFSQRHGDRVFREFSSLTSQPLHCRRGEETLWTPTTTGLSERPVPSVPSAPRSPALRLVQMRRIAERFQLNEGRGSRLLPQPLYRFESPSKGIVDGALFAFVVANDPELLLTVTLKAPAGKPENGVWNYALARMSSSQMTVRLDGQQIWQTTGYWQNPRTQSDPYVEALDRMIE